MKLRKYVFIVFLFIFPLNNNYGQNMRNIALENYFLNEILGGIEINIYDIKTKNEIYEYFGTPINETVNIEECFLDTSGEIIEDIFSTGTIGSRRIVYSDLIHSFAILKFRGRQLFERYNSIEINNPLERLQTINIGDNINKLIEAFGNNYNRTRDNNCIIYYGFNNMGGGIHFYFENNIINKIVCIFFYYE
jgi:hypothetical protein